jgi:murein DD-endopeptidase MepM/ murein hydrolase activator NlpD
MRRSSALAVLSLAFAGVAGALTGLPPVAIPPPSGEPLEVQGRAFVAEWVRTLRDTPDRYDTEAIVAEAMAKTQAGEARQLFFDRIALAIGALYLGFAPQDARHDDRARYRLPFPLEEPRLLSQGVGGIFTHQGPQHFSFDFAMPVGSRVLAAREGVVSRVRDGSERGGLDPAFAGTENDVMVLHADGTIGTYVHLRKGIEVREGQRVAPGDRIGYSGATGYGAGPHLHFAVMRRTGTVRIESVPIRFGVGSPVGFVPQEKQFYGGHPKRTVELALSANGAALTDATPLRLERGGRAQIRVEMSAPGAAAVDVTADAATHFYSPTDWSLVVEEGGIVVGSPRPEFAAAIEALSAIQPEGSTDWGVVVVTYERGDRGHHGFASFPVVIVDAATP